MAGSGTVSHLRYKRNFLKAEEKEEEGEEVQTVDSEVWVQPGLINLFLLLIGSMCL